MPGFLIKKKSQESPAMESLRALNERFKKLRIKETVFIEQMDSHALTVSYTPPQLIDLYNVYYHPDYKCLYDEEGYRIQASYAVSRRLDIPEKIKLPEGCEVVPHPFLYIGMFESYDYGHFLVEGIAQLWALAENSELPVFYASALGSIKRILKRRKKSYIDELMAHMPISRNDLYCSDELIKFEKIKVPQPTSVFGLEMLNHHRLIPEYFASRVIGDNGYAKNAKYDTIYLSRTRLKDGYRSIINEGDLESCLRSRGVHIVYPETLTLCQQVILLNSCKNIIATQGSALHSIIFILSKGVNVYTIASENTWLGTFYMIDQIKKAELTNTYIFTLTSAHDNDDSHEWMQDKVMDIEKTLEELSSGGLFKKN